MPGARSQRASWLLWLALASPASGACPERWSDRLTPPAAVSVTAVNHALVVSFTDPPDSLEARWSFALMLDDGTAGGETPTPASNLCGETAIYDWGIAINDFRLLPGGPHPTWFVHCAHAARDTIGEVEAVVTPGNPLRVTFEMPVELAVHGRQWWVLVHRLEPDCCAVLAPTAYHPAWSFSGIVP